MSARCSDTPGTDYLSVCRGLVQDPVDNKIQGLKSLSQWSCLLAPGTSFMENNFPGDRAQAEAGGYWFRQQWKAMGRLTDEA